MTLDDIEKSIFLGSAGLEEVLRVLKEYTDRKSYLRLDYLYIKDHVKEIPSYFVNRIYINEGLKIYVRKIIEKPPFPLTIREKLEDITKDMIDSLDAKIILVESNDTKNNLNAIKKEYVGFFKDNKDNLIELFKLYNMLVDFKDKVNHS